MTDTYPIRPIADDELAAFRTVAEHAFLGGPDSESDKEALRWLFEPDRSLAAFDPALQASAGPVGATGIYSFGMCVPGAVVPTAGVSYVGVLPHYRRRGILRSLMRRQLTDIAARGEPIAALWASETPLYGRYGYGRSSTHAAFRFGRAEGEVAPTAPTDPGLRLRLIDPAAAITELAKVYETVLAAQPGFFTRNDAWWRRVVSDPQENRGGFSPLRCMLAEDDSGPRGYSLYRTQGRWDDDTFIPDGQINISELITADPAAGAALWRDLLSRDLVTQITARLRPTDDPVLFQLVDPRRARLRLTDGLWVRIIDLRQALAARAYSRELDVVLEVSDELLTDNEGRWRLRTAGPAGSTSCERTTDPADIALDIRELGAAYLGGTRIGTLAGAGLVTELRSGALAPLSTAMSWDPAPWCPKIF